VKAITRTRIVEMYLRTSEGLVVEGGRAAKQFAQRIEYEVRTQILYVTLGSKDGIWDVSYR
jgi:hypothetical protein